MNFVFDNNTPIYVQLVKQLKISIISGRIATGERLPSVRDLALQAKVNPNTVQRAFAELEELGLVYTERTNGKFVTNNKQLILRYKLEYANEMKRKYIEAMANMGFTKEETLAFIVEKEEN